MITPKELPADVKIYIFQQLDPIQLLTSKAVCTEWNKLLTDKTIEKIILKFGEELSDIAKKIPKGMLHALGGRVVVYKLLEVSEFEKSKENLFKSQSGCEITFKCNLFDVNHTQVFSKYAIPLNASIIDPQNSAFEKSSECTHNDYLTCENDQCNNAERTYEKVSSLIMGSSVTCKYFSVQNKDSLEWISIHSLQLSNIEEIANKQ